MVGGWQIDLRFKTKILQLSHWWNRLTVFNLETTENMNNLLGALPTSPKEDVLSLYPVIMLATLIFLMKTVMLTHYSLAVEKSGQRRFLQWSLVA